jgi:hypothetical protein
LEVVAISGARDPLWVPLEYQIEFGDTIRRQNTASSSDALQPFEHLAVIKGFPPFIVESISWEHLTRYTLANPHLDGGSVSVIEFRPARC